jgi:tryptophan synthase alpha chain
LPLAVGFGISKRKHLQALKNHADIAIVGSALIDVVKTSEKGKRVEAVQAFLSKLLG